MSKLLKPDEIRFKRRDHFTSLARNLEHMFVNGKHVDVTLKVEGRLIKAHRLILCASSPFFEELLTKHHLINMPDRVITLEGFRFKELKTLIEYMYSGDMTALRENIPFLMETANALQIMELGEESDGPSPEESDIDIIIPNLIPADESTLVDENSNQIFIPPHMMAQVVHDDEIIHQEQGIEEDPDQEQQQLVNDDAHPDLNITDEEDFSLHLSESEDEVTENLAAADVTGGGTDRTGLKRKRSHSLSPSAAENIENESTEDESSTSSDDSSDEEATPRRSQPNRKTKYADKRSSSTTSAAGNRKKKRGARGRSGSSALFECKQCGRSYKHKGHLTRHSRFECGKDPSFICHLCGYQTYHKFNLSKHLMGVHKHEVEATKSHLKVGGFFRCDLCPFRERNPDAMQKHLETRHGDGH